MGICTIHYGIVTLYQCDMKEGKQYTKPNAPTIVQRIYDLYDEYCHGGMDRRTFLSRAAVTVVGGLAMAQALMPRYARAQTISFTDARMKETYDLLVKHKLLDPKKVDLKKTYTTRFVHDLKVMP